MLLAKGGVKCIKNTMTSVQGPAPPLVRTQGPMSRDEANPIHLERQNGERNGASGHGLSIEAAKHRDAPSRSIFWFPEATLDPNPLEGSGVSH